LIPAYSLVDLIDGSVLVSYFFSTPGTGKQNNRQPASGGGQLFTVEISLFIPALAEITSSKLLLGEGTVASPSPGCRAPQRCGTAPDANMVSNQSLEIIKLIFGARNDFVRQTAERYCVHHPPGVHVDT
jgi:hypothetical protein